MCVCLLAVALTLAVATSLLVAGDSEELLSSIAMVQSMGYNERQARAALASTDNNLER